MLANGWSIALLVCLAASFFLLGMACYSGVKILLFWDPAADTERQISLEGSTWLASSLVENGLAVQLLSFILLILAAGEFADMIAGAMCATGSFLANEYGVKSLYCKLAGLFLYGFWIVLHRLDLCSEYSPLIRVKFIYLLMLFPLLIADGYYTIMYLANLRPDIITSCCGVIFSEKNEKTRFLTIAFSADNVAILFYLLTLLLSGLGVFIRQRIVRKKQVKATIHLVAGGGQVVYFIVSLVAITVFFSSYIYAMPYHNCPFDILHGEYGYIGVPIYLSLFFGSFLAVTASAVSFFAKMKGLTSAVSTYQRYSLTIAPVLHIIFSALVTLPFIQYVLAGGKL